MNIKTYIKLPLLLLLFLPACLVNNSDLTSQEKSTLLIQEISNSPVVTSITKHITPVINGIIKKELGLDQEYDFAFFLPKKLQRITLYYLTDIYKKNQEALLSQLEKIKLIHIKPKNVSISSKVEFFGDQQDELVIMINDPEDELYKFNQAIRKIANQANYEHSQRYGKTFYDVAKSERYLFIPHMGLGRIRSQSIKNFIKDASQIPIIFERIKQKVKHMTLKTINESLTLSNNKLSFYKIGILDLKKQTYIKEWPQ